MPSAPARSLASDELFVIGGARQRTGLRPSGAPSSTRGCGHAAGIEPHGPVWFRAVWDRSQRSFEPTRDVSVPRPCGRRRRTPLLALACPVTSEAERQPYRLKFGVRELMALGAMSPRRIETACAWDRGPGSSVGTRSGCWRTGGGVERHRRDVNRLRRSEGRVKLNHLARTGSPVHFIGGVCQIRPVGSP